MAEKDRNFRRDKFPANRLLKAQQAVYFSLECAEEADERKQDMQYFGGNRALIKHLKDAFKFLEELED